MEPTTTDAGRQCSATPYDRPNPNPQRQRRSADKFSG